MTGRLEAERAAEFILRYLQGRHGGRWLQGRRQPALLVNAPSPAVRIFAEHRPISTKPEHAWALVAWAEGWIDADLSDRALPASEIVELQARGRRVVSLLPGDDAKALEFALHDLKHLARFNEAAHHRAQRGFFCVVAQAQRSAKWAAFDEKLDALWCEHRDYVLADMNGSPIFLLGYLKLRLRAAARRMEARQRGLVPPRRGPLTDEEERAYQRLLEAYLDVLGLTGAVREAARQVEVRGANGGSACQLESYFDDRANEELAR